MSQFKNYPQRINPPFERTLMRYPLHYVHSRPPPASTVPNRYSTLHSSTVIYSPHHTRPQLGRPHRLRTKTRVICHPLSPLRVASAPILTHLPACPSVIRRSHFPDLFPSVHLFRHPLFSISYRCASFPVRCLPCLHLLHIHFLKKLSPARRPLVHARSCTTASLLSILCFSFSFLLYFYFFVILLRLSVLIEPAKSASQASRANLLFIACARWRPTLRNLNAPSHVDAPSPHSQLPLTSSKLAYQGQCNASFEPLIDSKISTHLL